MAVTYSSIFSLMVSANSNLAILVTIILFIFLGIQYLIYSLSNDCYGEIINLHAFRIIYEYLFSNGFTVQDILQERQTLIQKEVFLEGVFNLSSVNNSRDFFY